MNYAKIIHEAWELTTNNSKLKWFAFIPSFAGVLFFVGEIIWQIGLLSEEWGWLEHSFVYKTIWDGVLFLSHNELLGAGVFIIIFVLLFQFVLPAWIQSSLIIGVKQKIKTPEKYLSARQMVMNGFEYFPKLVEIRAILAPFALISLLFYFATAYRWLPKLIGGGKELYWDIFVPSLIVFFFVSFFINVFTAFCEYLIVCNKTPVGKSLKESIGLVFLNFGSTMSVILLMFLVNFRVIINVLVVMGIPIGLFFVLSSFAQSSWLGVAMVIVSLISIALLALTAYLSAILEVFSTTVWLKTLITLQEKQVELNDEE